MDAIQRLSSEIRAVITGNTTYNTYFPIWRYLLESYVGGEEYRRAHHLTRYQLETDQEYTARLLTTPLPNHCKSVISVYNSFLFRRPPKRNFGESEISEDIDSFLRDCDWDGRSLDAFMKDVTTWASVFGTVWVVVAKPNIGALTRADELANGVRPYVNLITPMNMLDWQWERRPSGKYELTYIKYLEDSNEDVRTVKEWRPDTIRTVVVNVKENTKLLDETVENQLGRVPAVCAYNTRSIIRGIGVSDIQDIADTQKFIYNALSEVEQSIRLDSHPSLVTTGDTEIGTGAGALIRVPENLDPGLKPYVLDFTGAEISSIYQAIKHAEDSIDKMANTGAVRAVESRTLSGVAMETEMSLLSAKLSEKADQMELVEEQIWELYYAYQGSQWMGEIHYPDSFNIRDTASEIQQLKTAKETATSDLIIREIDHRIADWMGIEDPEFHLKLDEFVPHIMQNPETGEQRVAQTEAEHLELAALGWIHP